MFDIINKRFNSKKRRIDLISPLSGRVMELDQVPDKVFSDKLVGDGIAIEPTEGILVSPVDGVIRQIFPTMHAVGIGTEEGIGILIHIGINTVSLNGEGFEKLVKEGDKVKAGDKLIKFDIDYIRENSPSIVTPIVITNMDEFRKLKINNLKEVEAGNQEIFSVIL